MPEHTLIALATAWGPQHGGINSFNHDLLCAVGIAFQHMVRTICIVPAATSEEKQDARQSFVELRTMLVPHLGETLEAEHAPELLRSVADLELEGAVWVGHDVFTGEAALQAAALSGTDAAVFNHMSYIAYKAFQSQSGEIAREKSKKQAAVLGAARWRFAVGPLLRDELSDLLKGKSEITTVVPGLPDVAPAAADRCWTMMLFGRLDPATDRIKQTRLGVAAFARAHVKARQQAGSPAALRGAPRLKLFGVAPEDELSLRQFCSEKAEAALDLHPLPFETNRDLLFQELARASVAVMPSWHEGFGLTGWEAIGAGVPLVLSNRSGLFRLLDEQLAGAGTGSVRPIHIRGLEHESRPYHDEDVEAIADALLDLAAEPDRSKRTALKLRELLRDFTWSRCAENVIVALGWQGPSGAVPVAQPVESPLPPQTTPPPPSAPKATDLITMPAAAWRPNAGHADSVLLRAEEACVPFDDGRVGTLDGVIEWVNSDHGYPLMVRLYTGAAGTGKTRLLLEACRRLGTTRVAGFLSPTCAAADIPDRLVALLQPGEVALIVVDYAETRRTEVATLIQAALKCAGCRLRIALLARDAGEWWERFVADFPECEAILAGAATEEPIRLAQLHASIEEREFAYKAAIRAFAARIGEHYGERQMDSIPDLSGEHFGRPLYLQMSALLSLRGERHHTAVGLTDGVLRHEEHYWNRVGLAHNLASAGTLAARLMVLATLAGGIETIRGAAELHAASGGAPHDKAAVSQLYRILCQLYPARQGLRPMTPDVLGEGLTARVLALAGESPAAFFAPLLGAEASEAVRRHAITVLGRLAQHRPETGRQVEEAVSAHYPSCAAAIVHVSLETGQPLPEIATSAFVSLPGPLKARAADALKTALPDTTILLGELAAAVYVHEVAVARVGCERYRSDEKRLARLAAALLSAGDRCGEIGQDDKALECAEEAHTLFRQLASVRPQRFNSQCAGALNNLANALSVVGRLEEALERAKESEAMFRRLADGAFDRHGGDHAMALSNLGNRLAALGHHEEALGVAQEADAMYGRLVYRAPTRYEVAAANCLSNLAGRLSEVGRFEEALACAEKCKLAYARLAEAKPDAYEAHFAMSVSRMSTHLQALGRSAEAYEGAEQAHSILERLAAVRPARYSENLATCLHNLGNRLSDMGRCEDALACALRALEIFKRLAAENPNRHEWSYASSLANVGSHLEDLGRCGESLERGEAALAVFDRLSEVRPGGYDEHRAMCLQSMASSLSALGKYEDAVRRRMEGHRIVVRLSEGRPERYRSELANSLEHLGGDLADVGDFSGGLALLEEAKVLWSDLAERFPRRFAEAALIIELEVAQCSWLLGREGWEGRLTWRSRSSKAEVPGHRRPVLDAAFAMVMACYAHSAGDVGAPALMEEVVDLWRGLPNHLQRRLDAERVVATSYLARYRKTGETVRAAAVALQEYRLSHGDLSRSASEMIARLGCGSMS